ncbi:signal transduction protein [Citrobacter braakii]|uniref:cyclic di-GMP phosphodiesterase n=1 Tax=Citrobacter braakii TaxID=57706 RepID=UPI000E167A64|nr:cyclic di-GMP phosphodiesterase [Citrobacter braakii]QXA94570.1 cyclic di-GMP phosphodiesterase [Citrobacter braakii]STB39924.1 signal transduction protein [Citrobacter braakii]SUX61203.1 signal transduction protein [Citrobacter braakii]
MFKRSSSSNQKILLSCMLTGLIVALLVSTLQFFVTWHKRDIKYDTLLSDIQNYVSSYFADLKSTTDDLQPLVANSCQQVAAQLTSSAAFSLNVRAFLLVKNGIAFCSSATGAMFTPILDLVPSLDISRNIDVELLPGTPMMPNKPAIMIWHRNPSFTDSGVFTSLNINLAPYLLYTARQDDFNGIAIVVGDNAISTFSSRIIDASALPHSHWRQATVEGIPLQIRLYADEWTYTDIWYSIMLGCMAGIIAALLLWYYIYTIRLRPGKDILNAIKHNQFYVVYQPVVEVQTLEVKGVEVLLRWNHPTTGEIPPDAFIHYAESQKMIVPLTQHLFKLIAQDAPMLQKVLPAGAKLGINIAPTHLHGETFKDDIHHLQASLPANHLQMVLEITERDMLNQHEATKLFEWLHSAGFEIAIDDFGTGHSALIYLERFTVDYLKIDRGFINAIGTETLTSPVLDAVLTLSKRLNMLTVAEGVETPEQARWLRDRGVHFFQGYWISRPLKLADFVRWMAQPNKPTW